MPATSTIIAVASLVVGAASTAYSITQQQKAADQQAAAEQQRAKTEAEMIRERAQRAAASQEAQLAGSGVQLGPGLGAELPAETIQLAEKDALSVLKGGAARADLLTSQASAGAVGQGLAFAGKAAGTAYNIFNTPSSTQAANVPSQPGSPAATGTGYNLGNYSNRITSRIF